MGPVRLVPAGGQAARHGRQPERLHARLRPGLVRGRDPPRDPDLHGSVLAAADAATRRRATSSGSCRRARSASRPIGCDGGAIVPGSGVDLRAHIADGVLRGTRRRAVADRRRARANGRRPRSIRCTRSPGPQYAEKFFGQFEDRNPGEGGKGLNFFFSDELEFRRRRQSLDGAVRRGIPQAQGLRPACRNCRRCSWTSARARPRCGSTTAT